MAIKLQLRRGTAEQNDAFTGALGEPSFNTTSNSIRIHDGSTQGGHIILGEPNISNCITEIPQNIKYELNNGVLTIKAGSKFYMPDGNGVFTEKNLDQDRTYSLSGNGQRMLFANQYLSGVDGYEVSHVFSGTTAPSGYTYMFWYDTANNVIKSTQDGGVTWGNKYTLPLFVVTLASGTGVVSVDQVFNGIGYVGGTVFALPGVKALAPNGRNADGTLKSAQIEISSVQTLTQGGTYNRHLFLTNSNVLQATTNAFAYDEPTNILKVNNAVVPWCYCGEVGMTNGQITSFETNTLFHAVDYNYIKSLSGLADNADYVIEKQDPSSSNNYQWYRKYRSGWVEQGGICINSSGDGSVTLPIPMSDTNYQVIANNEQTSGEGAWGWIYSDTKTTAGFNLHSRYGGGTAGYLRGYWFVCGIAA